MKKRKKTGEKGGDELNILKLTPLVVLKRFQLFNDCFQMGLPHGTEQEVAASDYSSCGQHY